MQLELPKGFSVDENPPPSRSFRDSYGPNESRRILKNLVMLGISFMVLFTANKGLFNIQSSIKTREAGAEMDSLAVLYVANLLAAIFLPSFFMSKLKCKWTILLSISGYTLYIVAQFYPVFETLLSSAFYCGICSALIWVAHPVYVTCLAEEYAILKNEKPEVVVPRFFGIFYVFHQSSQVTQALSSLVLSTPVMPDIGMANGTRHQFRRCGAQYCDPHAVEFFSNHTMLQSDAGSPVNDGAPERDINILMGVLIALAIGSGIIIFFFLDSLARYGENERSLCTMTKWDSLLIATVKHWKKPKQILLIPMTIWYGVNESFFGVEFTKGFIKCAWGMDKIGFVMISFGVSAAITAFAMGRLIAYIGRPLVLFLAAAFNAACMVAMIFWEPTPTEPILFFILAGLWGAADGIWQPQIRALYGMMFPDTRDAAFSNLGCWMSIGYIMVYLTSEAICMKLKLYWYLGFVAFAMICYGFAEIMARFQRTRKTEQHK